MDLEADLRALLIAELELHTEYLCDLIALDTRRLLGVYGNWANRFPPVQPRQVLRSREIDKLVGGSDVLAGDVRVVLAELEAGADLEYRLSKDVDVAWVPPSEPKRKRLRQLDRYLAAWGIHHVHLGAPSPEDGKARSSDLLYVVFVEDHVYVLAALPHGAWHSDRLLHIAADNWPDGGPLLTSKHLVGLEREFTETERADLLRENVAVPFTRNGHVYSARDNVSLNGTSLNAESWANQTHLDLTRAAELLEREPEQIRVALRRRFPDRAVESTTWVLEIRDQAFAVVDTGSGSSLRLDEVTDLSLV